MIESPEDLGDRLSTPLPRDQEVPPVPMTEGTPATAEMTDTSQETEETGNTFQTSKKGKEDSQRSSHIKFRDHSKTATDRSDKSLNPPTTRASNQSVSFSNNSISQTEFLPNDEGLKGFAGDS